MTAWCGLGLLLLVAAGIVLTGLPAFVVLIAVIGYGGYLRRNLPSRPRRAR